MREVFETMTLKKAKELLQQDLDDPGSVDITDLNQAQTIGIEAIAYILKERYANFPHHIPILKGETKD